MNLIPANAEISRLKVAEHLLDNGVMMVHLLSARDGVVLPDFLKTQIVRLNFSYRYGIDDFEVDSRGIRASLSFNGVPQFCDIPWTAVCGLSSGVTDEFFIWIDIFDKDEISKFLPAELADQFSELKNASILEEMPELKPYAVDEEDEEEDDDIPPGGYKPLSFV